jgi:hypothetical protein
MKSIQSLSRLSAKKTPHYECGVSKILKAPNLSNRTLYDMNEAVFFIESNTARFESKQRMVAAHADIRTRMVASPPLAHNNVARDNALTTKLFNAQAF